MAAHRVRRSASPLPAQPNPLIGRERDLAAILERLCAPTVRLITITGPAGAGKTRLAMAAAADFAASAPDGIWFVDLAPIREPQRVFTTIGRAMGVREQRGELAQARIQRHIGQRRVLLVLDNFEQVLPAAAGVADLLAACSNLKILATSRMPLRLRWERVFPAEPLAVPELRVALAPEQLAEIPAVALYVDRAQAVDPSFRLTSANAAAVAEMCVRLDGLPLAIELAAARSDVYTPAQILARLRRRLDLLTGGGVDVPARQRSLEAAFNWSYHLLSAAHQALFRALGVFVGGFTPAAARAVAGAENLTVLVQHSLVRRQPGDDARFRMLETVRTYALDRLERSGERRAKLEQHAGYMLELAEQAARELLGPHQATWLARLECEHDNLAAALRWAMDSGATEIGLRLAGALWRFWWLHGHLSEGMAWLEAVLSASSSPPESLLPARAAALNGAGVLAQVRGEYERATELIAESLDVSRRFGLGAGMAAALHNQGALARERGDWPRALRAYEESLSLEREMGNTWGIATSLTNLGALAADQGAFERARVLLNQSLALQREVGDARGIASALHNLAVIARETGDWQRAVALEEQSLATWRTLGDRWGLAAALHDLARAVERLGDSTRAARLLGESLALFVELGVRQGSAACLEGLAAVACSKSRCPAAARLLGAAHSLREAIGAPLPARDRQDVARVVSVVRSATSRARFRTAWHAGEALGAEEAASEAMRLAAELGVEHPSSSKESVLTTREREVVGLVADGLSNRQIAERLVISERTADRHLSNILAKLGLKSRAQVARWATERAAREL